MIVFQHTLLSLVANVQLSSNDVLQLGDWIEMPDKNLSGEVTDIALHTITIRNWDNTISRIPTKNFPHRDLYQLAGDVLLRGAADHAQYRHRSALGAFSRPGDALLDADHPRGE
ncbi:mechanosensitive ion channel family protein [Klebsiella variicola subsp. variicola]|nr:mechanosensitive ion channel family protein [Klebsiella variicola subsp. variicola]